MEQRLPQRVPEPLVVLALTVLTAAAWAAWLGWDQHHDVQPDGSSTGPYESWQVIGLVLTLLAPVYWAASRHHVPGAVLGIPAGLTVSAYYDWSDDSSGLFLIGVGMVMLGSLVATTAVAAVIAFMTRQGPHPGTTEQAAPPSGS